MWSEIIICADDAERNGLGATNILTVPPSTTCDHQEALECSGQKSDCLLVGFFHYLNQTCCRQRLLSVWNQK